VIELSDVCLSFGSHKLFEGLNLKLEARKTHILLGPSGCGKTSILRLISGLSKAQSGIVRIDGKDINTFDQKQIAKNIGFMFQEDGLFPHMTVEENILFPAKIHSELSNDIEKYQNYMNQLFEMVHLNLNLKSRFPNSLSGGQKQRVSLIRSLILDQNIILMDEPMSALDPMVRMALQKDLREIFSQLKKTVVFVTHNLSEASFLGDVIYLINDGGILQKGSFKDIYHSPATPFVKDFINAQMPINI
jgi:osmoprotectant transport system ATP-binding protein